MMVHFYIKNKSLDDQQLDGNRVSVQQTLELYLNRLPSLNNMD
jgi:hypothetical protein